jgi:sulfotransferase
MRYFYDWFLRGSRSMNNGVHFISGLPRSGSTLLSALLRQNPKLHASMTSGLGGLVLGALRQMSGAREGSVFVDQGRREAVLRGIFEGYYHDVHPSKIVLDTNRVWCAKLSTLKILYPGSKVVCCVRDMPWIYDSIERLIQRNALIPSRMFDFEVAKTVYDRFETLHRPNGMVGYAYTALRQAFYGADSDRLLLVTFETLTKSPLVALNAIYSFLDLPRFEHDFERIGFDDPQVAEFDKFLGTPGLHQVGQHVKVEPRPTILPPDLFNRVASDNFWNDRSLNPRGVSVI